MIVQLKLHYHMWGLKNFRLSWFKEETVSTIGLESSDQTYEVVFAKQGVTTIDKVEKIKIKYINLFFIICIQTSR